MSCSMMTTTCDVTCDCDVALFYQNSTSFFFSKKIYNKVLLQSGLTRVVLEIVFRFHGKISCVLKSVSSSIIS